MRALLLLATCLLAGCGSGAIAAALAGGRKGGTPPTTRVASLTVDRPEGPMFAPSGSVQPRTVIVNNVRIASSAVIRVELRGLDTVAPQPSPLLLSAEDQGSRIGFLLDTTAIRQRIPDPTAGDVAVKLAVLVDGKEVAPPVAFLLLRQPSAELVLPPGQTQAYLAMDGGTRLTLRVRGLKATGIADAGMQFAIRNPNGSGVLVLSATDLQLTDEPSTGAKLLSGIAPSSVYPTRVLVAASDSRAGQSTVVFEVFYRPSPAGTSPRFVPTDGALQVALFGTGLVPLDFRQQPPAPNFDLLELSIVKGGRRTAVPPEALRRDQSSLTRLVFTLPPAPDGRPGPAELVLRVALDVAWIEVRAPDLLRYGHGQPQFGPRGTALPAPALDFAFAAMTGSARSADLATIESSGQAGLLRLFGANDAGSWLRLGPAIASGDPSDPAGRRPVALATGDADRDQLADLLAIHAGTAAMAAHSILLAQPPPSPVLQRAATIPDLPGTARALAVDADGDALADLLVLPEPTAGSPAPRLFLARPVAPGKPAYVAATLPARDGFDVACGNDLDGDGRLDLAFARGGPAPRVELWFGDGAGAFSAGPSLPLDVPGHRADPRSRAVGIHASGPGPHRALLLVLGGLAASTDTPPVVALLPPGAQPRTWQAPAATNVLRFPAHDQPFVASLARDLDQDGIDELVVAAGGAAAVPLRLLQRTAESCRELAGAVEAGSERIRDARALSEGIAVPADERVVTTPIRGLRLLHRADVDGLPEERVSTFLVAPGPRLLAPDPGAALPQPILGLAAGDFRGRGRITPRAGRADDLWVAVAGGLRRLDNDGSGTWTAGPLLAADPVPPTLLAAPLAAAGQGDSLVFLQPDGRLAVVAPGAERIARSQVDLRLLAPEAIRARPVGGRSRIASGDVDGDGLPDLAVLLVLADPVEPKEAEAILVLLRGRPTADPGDVYVYEPDPAQPAATVHGSASGLALGDLVRAPGAPARLEAAIAVPRGEISAPVNGNHVRFLRYEPGSRPSADRFVRSFSDPALQVLAAGDEPEQIACGDLDADGTTDLAIATGGDRHLRWFLNSGAFSTSAPHEVHVAAFHAGPGASAPLPAGRPTWIAVLDATGSGAPGIAVATEDRTAGRDTAVLICLGSGEGQIVSTFLLPQARSGNRLASGALRDAALHPALADCDADGSADFLLGWESAGDRNLRILLGGAR